MVDQEKDDFSSHERDGQISDKNKDQNKNTNENIIDISKTIPQINNDLYSLQENVIDKATKTGGEQEVIHIIHNTKANLETMKESVQVSLVAQNNEKQSNEKNNGQQTENIQNSPEQQKESAENTNNKPQKRLLQQDTNQNQKKLTTNTFIYPSAETIAQNKLQAAERPITILKNLSNPEYISNPNWFMRNVILPITENIGKNT